MKIKKNILFFCFFIFIVSIASVSAGEVNSTLISDEAPSDEIDDVVLSSQDEMNATGNDNTFTALQNIIDNSKKGSTITLDKDYKYDEGFNTKGISIDKDLTIDGNGHTLDGLSKSRILLLKFGLINNHKITLNNIKFENGHTDLYGGAIFNYANLTVNNCTFTNNYAEITGGAVNSVGHLICKNSKFYKNSANGDAGAVFTLSLQRAVDYFAEYYKNRAVTGNMDFLSPFSNDITLKFLTDQISNCVFKSNVAKGRGGGAVYAFGPINIKSSIFKYNKAGEHGGAVFANRDLYIKNSKFTKNSAPTNGGAVYFKCHGHSGHYDKNGKWVSEIEYYKNSIKSSTFTKNSASKGGALYGFTTSSSDKTHCIKASKCTFEANKASKGRDVYGGTTSNCEFRYVKLTLKTVTVKKSAKKLVLTATLKKGKTALNKKTVTFKFNGKTYTAKTNSKGIAKATVKNNVLKKLKVGKKITYLAKYAKLTVKKTAKVKK